MDAILNKANEKLSSGFDFIKNEAAPAISEKFEQTKEAVVPAVSEKFEQAKSTITESEVPSRVQSWFEDVLFCELSLLINRSNIKI